MVEQANHVRRGRIDWNKVGSGFEITPTTADLYLTFSQVIEKLKAQAKQDRTVIDGSAWATLEAILIEATSDLLLALDIQQPLFFCVSFDMRPTNIGRSLVLNDGSRGIMFNGHALLEAAKCLTQAYARIALGDRSPVDPNSFTPIMLTIDILAHELGHHHILELYPEKVPPTTQSWDVDQDAPSREELAAYIHNCYEAHATSVSIRYFRRKQQVGEPLWQALGAVEMAKNNLANILVAGHILDQEEMKKLLLIIKSATYITPEEAEQIKERAAKLYVRCMNTQVRVAAMEQRLEELAFR